MRQQILLVDYNKEMCDAWRFAFKDCKDVSIHEGDYFSVPADCYVSPCNSHGFLNGGIDTAICKLYERNNIDIQGTVHDYIKQKFDGEILVGQAIYIPITHFKQIPHLIVAPTMRVPMILPKDSVNVYLAMRAILIQFKRMCMGHVKGKSISISGLGTGVGKMPYEVCARQMKQAYDDFWIGENYFPKTWREAQDKHQLVGTGKIDGDLQY